MKQKVYILIPGIWSKPDDNFGWTDEAEDWIEHNCPNTRARKYKYFSTALFRRIGQQKRARDVAAIASRLLDDGCEVSMVGHSNGADIICRAMKLLRPVVGIHAIHLIAGACEEDFRKNGLNHALVTGKVHRVVVYASHSDSILRDLASKSRWFSWLGLGYGQLGLTGGKGVNHIMADQVVNHFEDHLDHCQWFAGAEFIHTMKRITEPV